MFWALTLCHSLWRRASAWNVSLLSFYGGSRGVRWVRSNPLFCLKFTLKAQEMASPTFQIVKFSQGSMPPDPPACHIFCIHEFEPLFTKSWISPSLSWHSTTLINTVDTPVCLPPLVHWVYMGTCTADLSPLEQGWNNLWHVHHTAPILRKPLWLLGMNVIILVSRCPSILNVPESTAFTSLSLESALNNGHRKNWPNLQNNVDDCAPGLLP